MRKGLLGMNKTLNTWEMVKAIAENPKRKAECSGGIITLVNGRLCWEDGEAFTINYQKTGCWDSLTADWWTIIEPPKKLKEMSIQEIAKYYSLEIHKETISSSKFKSLVTGRTLSESNGFAYLTEKEIDGLWTIEGVYEDD